ncbi:DUF6518 family protein [Frondihabitans australicus]|uniref:Uncharacterized protein n=1 Tax=Frondihabitans australicus TaxID=386892 RepID=A0A495IK14_9MICO|nr:DUF6518 family protein [Frondihabitans australicus]RKR75631.1 hypothetical protein C8E83_2779 [Frondihabitans australicus]
MMGLAFSALQISAYLSPHPLSDLFEPLNLGSVWALVGMLGGRLGRSRLRSVIATWLTLSSAVLSYYVLAWFSDGGDFPLFSTGYWLMASLVAGPVLALLATAASRRTRGSVLASLVIPFAVVAESLVPEGRFSPDPATVSIACTCAFAGAVILIATRGRGHQRDPGHHARPAG